VADHAICGCPSAGIGCGREVHLHLDTPGYRDPEVAIRCIDCLMVFCPHCAREHFAAGDCKDLRVNDAEQIADRRLANARRLGREFRLVAQQAALARMLEEDRCGLAADLEIAQAELAKLRAAQPPQRPWSPALALPDGWFCAVDPQEHYEVLYLYHDGCSVAVLHQEDAASAPVALREFAAFAERWIEAGRG
jgi:hypothetical protein